MRPSKALIPMLLGAAAIMGGGSLVTISSATAAIYSGPQALSPQTIQQFLANPAAWLAQFHLPNDAGRLIAQVRDLVASDPATLGPLLALLTSANPDQSSAIGTGLGQVAVMAVKTDQAFATQLQTDVVQTRNVSAVAAFSVVVGGDIQLAAAGPGTGGAGGGGESGTGTNGTTGGFTTPPLFDLHTFSNNTADSFSSQTFTPGSSVSQTIP